MGDTQMGILKTTEQCGRQPGHRAVQGQVVNGALRSEPQHATQVALYKETPPRLLTTHLPLHHFTKLPKDVPVSRQQTGQGGSQVSCMSRCTGWRNSTASRDEAVKAWLSLATWCCSGPQARGETADPTLVLGSTNVCPQAQRWGETKNQVSREWKVKLQERVKGGSKGHWIAFPSTKNI